MTPVDPSQRAIVHGLQAEFEPEVGLLGQVADEVERGVRQTVRTRCDRQSDHAGKIQRLTVKFLELHRRIVGVGVALKIGDKTLRSMSFFQRDRAVFELGSNRRPGTVVLRRVARVVAIDTTADRDRTVAVGTGKVESQTDLIDPCVKNLAKRAVEGVVSLAAPMLVE